ncbi:WXG100 family type VII secretion target [Streptomyces mirabilis]|jgi:WXG100 family type VII secretion target|uniref:WXG100 family type VII secretion target n=1 Tax=Streptomyces mirabilis TaxID=68239 RepID=UPI003325C31C
MSTRPAADDGRITISFSTLHELATELEDILKQLNDKLEGLYERVQPVVLSWKGEAREVFVQKLNDWDRSAQDLQAAQKRLHAYVVTGHANYAAAHRAVLRGWGAA